MRNKLKFLPFLTIVLSNLTSIGQDLSTNLSIYYSFDGNVNDMSGNNNDGILHNSPTLTTGHTGTSNSAYLFNGVNDWLELPNLGELSNQSWSYSIWFKLTTVPTSSDDMFLLRYTNSANTDDGHLYIDNVANQLTSFYQSTGLKLATSTVINAGIWTHAVITYNNTSNTTKIYVNGVLEATSTTYNFTSPSGGNTMSVFEKPNGGGAYGDGVIDELRFYQNRILTQCDVSSLYLDYPDLNNQTETINVCMGSDYTFIDGTTVTNITSNITHLSSFPSVITGCDSASTETTLNIIPIDNSVSETSNILVSNQSGAVYQWVYCPSYTAITGENSQSFIAQSNGDYAVILVYNGCIDTSTCFSITNLGIIENDFEHEFLLYPNPTDGNFSIDLGKSYQKISITLLDLKGNILQSKIYNESQLLHLKIEEPAGVYFFMIESGNKKAVIRLVKE